MPSQDTPIFLPPRSMAQAEFIEVLERLASGWKVGIHPHSVMRAGSVANRLAIEAPPVSPSNSLFEVLSSFSLGDTVDSFCIFNAIRLNVVCSQNHACVLVESCRWSRRTLCVCDQAGACRPCRGTRLCADLARARCGETQRTRLPSCGRQGEQEEATQF
ncbi:hypothetical protein EV363DRAFT_1317849 [Boletus edulis]|nr:hypothetical protein EV363DRAFT_1317849 [Boletus edulis]